MELLTVGVQGVSLSMAYHPPTVRAGATPLLVGLHGGTYTSAYFAVAGGPLGSFLDVASRNGFGVLTIDRPGYGKSDAVPEATNTFERQGELLDAAIAEATSKLGHAKSVLVGHSIGGMIALEVAARRPTWGLVGVAVTGMCSRIPPGGAAEELAAAPFSGVIDLPIPNRDGIMFGPAGSYTTAAQHAAHATYAPTPFVELVEAPSWARKRLRHVASQIDVPVENVIAEHDALWESSAEARAEFESVFAGKGRSILAPGVGHSIDHHVLGARLHLQQLAFAYACATQDT